MIEKKSTNVMVVMPQAEYLEAVEFKETHGRLTWREIIMDYIDIINELDRLREEKTSER